MPVFRPAGGVHGAIKQGAFNYLPKPATARQILAALDDTAPEAAAETATLNPTSLRRLEWQHIQQVLADHDGNIDNVSMKRRTQDFTEIVIDLSVWDLKHLNAIVAELRGKRTVSRVDRVNG